MKKQSKKREEIFKVLDKLEEKNDIEKDIAEGIAITEYYYGYNITGSSPIMKRFNQMESLNKVFDLDARRFGMKTDG